MTVLVTRPQGQADALLAALQQAGFDVSYCPALGIEPVALSAAERRLLLDLDHYHAVIFVSRNAAHFALTAMADVWPQWPVGVHWVAVGNATAAELSRWQLSATVPVQGFNSEAVLSLPSLQQLEEKRVLLCRGQQGRQLLSTTLQTRGALVHELALYRRFANPDFVCPPHTDWVLVTSVEGWQAMRAVLPEQVGVIAAGERVAQAIQAQHRGAVYVADSAHDEDMMAALMKACQ